MILFENLTLDLVFSAIELKWSLKVAARHNGSVTAAPLRVSICIFDANECLVAIKIPMPFHIFLKLFELFLTNRS